jgi:hypothetical protein
MPWVGFLQHAVLGKDKGLRYNPLEKKLIIDNRLKVFTFASGNLHKTKMAALVRAWLPNIARISTNRDGPFVASITENGVHIRGGFDAPKSHQ